MKALISAVVLLAAVTVGATEAPGVKGSAAPKNVKALLGSCSKDARAHFFDNLVFVNGALVEADYSALKKCMTDEQLTALFDYMGIKGERNMLCESRATCGQAINKICTSNCRGKAQ